MGSKRLQSAAENVAMWYAVKVEKCIHIPEMPVYKALRSRFHRQDFWGADVMGMRKNGSKVWIQVTTGGSSAVSARKKRLMHLWGQDDTVLMMQISGRHGKYFMTVWRKEGREWKTLREKERIPNEWFRPLRMDTNERRGKDGTKDK